MRRELWVLLILALVAGVFLSPFASPFPDGLERVAEDKGFAEKGGEVLHSPIPDYVFPGIGNEKLATALAGLLGTLLTLGVASGIAVLLRRRGAEQVVVCKGGAEEAREGVASRDR